MAELSVVEICAGAGGQSLGLHRAGFDHMLSLEIDPQAAATLRHNLERIQDRSPDVRVGDVADQGLWRPEDYEGVDLLAGGVPCPPFSVAGKQLGSQDERDLFAWAVELAGRIQPRALLLENVRGLSAPRFAGYRQAIADRLEELDYASAWRMLHANEFGVPQLRPRFVLVAMRPDSAAHFSWPTPLEDCPSVGDVLRESMGERGWRYADRWADQAVTIAPTIVGGSKKHGGADLGPTRAKRAWAQLMVDGHGVADHAPTRNDPSFRTRMPKLTNEMVARIQGWHRGGEDWEFLGRKTSTYRQIGNAFPPPVAEAIGNSINAALNESAAASGGLESTVHDDLYRLLKGSSKLLTMNDIVKSLGLGNDLSSIARRLQTLSEDFVLHEMETSQGLAYGLGEFKAFRGQEDHGRHSHFADARTRARVS
ncbi:DNA cytosine methyltransferase [Nocardioides iriomotensis]|uniref:Cytosine-specific methyltransferase n=1 Tax=Nocardioides iriomotensis TaxID=715784 RepID=A0A4Q5IV46_9ACTN|nr:DNA (cytosine-5-)-methyltransferase [Nocardioides iriomotensis]RYU09673.1 DNA (cytosine-5-)-methyltransferase [Nocardioides iriomotensis]